MKVLVIQPWISYRGSEKISVRLVQILNRQGHQARLAAIYVDHQRLPLGGEGVSCRVAPWWLEKICRWSRVTWFVFGFPTLLYVVWRASYGVDVLNPHNLPAHWAALLVSRLRWLVDKCRRPARQPMRLVVWTCHNLPQKPELGRVGGWVWDRLVGLVDRLAARRYAAVVTFSRKTARQLRRLGCPIVLVRPAGIDAEFYGESLADSGHESHIHQSVVARFPPLRRAGIGSKHSRDVEQRVLRRHKWRHYKEKDSLFLLLQVSKLHPAKNHQLSLRVLVALKDKCPLLRLAMVGEGVYRGQLRELAAHLGVAERVVWTGYQNAEKVREWYRVSDLCLSPGYATEGCTLAPLEALCQGKVSLVARGSGVDEYLESQGIGLVGEPTVKDFARQVEWAVHHPRELGEMGERGKAWVCEKLKWGDYARWMVEDVLQVRTPNSKHETRNTKQIINSKL